MLVNENAPQTRTVTPLLQPLAVHGQDLPQEGKKIDFADLIQGLAPESNQEIDILGEKIPDNLLASLPDQAVDLVKADDLSHSLQGIGGFSQLPQQLELAIDQKNSNVALVLEQNRQQPSRFPLDTLQEVSTETGKDIDELREYVSFDAGDAKQEIVQADDVQIETVDEVTLQQSLPLSEQTLARGEPLIANNIVESVDATASESTASKTHAEQEVAINLRESAERNSEAKVAETAEAQTVNTMQESINPSAVASTNVQATPDKVTANSNVQGNSTSASSNSTVWSTQMNSSQEQTGNPSTGNQGSQQNAQQNMQAFQNMAVKATADAVSKQNSETSIKEANIKNAATPETLLKTESGDALLGERRSSLPTALQSIPVPVRHPQWGQALGQRIHYMVNAQVQQAQINLNPEKLGPIQIKLHFDRDQQMQISIVAQHGVTREAIDASIPRLREMMEQTGVNLASVDVDSGSSFKEQADAEHEQTNNRISGAGNSGMTSMSIDETADSRHVVTDGLVDYYA